MKTLQRRPDAPVGNMALSQGQAAMWAMSRYREGGFYIEQIVVRFAGRPDPAALERAWKETVDSIAALRLVIDGRTAVILKSAPGGWTTHDGAFPSAGAPELLEADRRAGFPDERRPPWRCQYWPADGVLLWTVHHALLDGRSISEVLVYFLRLAAGADPGTPPGWSGCLAADDAESARARSVMEGLAPPFREDEEPFTWQARGAAGDGIPWRVRLSLPPGLRELLETRALACGSTAHGLVQWAWAWTVARAGGYGHATLGVVRSAHWSVPAGLRAAGYLMTTVPIPARVEADCTLGDALRLYREAVLAVRDFTRSDPLGMAAGLGRPAGNPWDAVVMTENSSLEELVLPRLPAGHVDSIEIHERTGEPLTASAWLGGRPEIEIEALPDRFSGPAARRLAETWLKAIRLVAESGDDTPLGRLDPLCDECLTRIHAHESGGPAMASGFGGIWQAFQKTADLAPDAPALLVRGVTTTYAGLKAAAESLAATLIDAGVSAGDCVASRIDDRAHAPVVVLACARIQAVYMPFDADIPPERLGSMMRIAQPAAIISDAGMEEADIVRIDPRRIRMGTAPLRPFAPHDEWLPFCLLFTSGSTGEPKGVINHHHGILNEVIAVGKMLGFRPDDRVLQFASLGFDAALEEILGTLVAGACLVPREESILESFELYQDFLVSNGITIADLPTAYWAGWCAWLDANNHRPPDGLRAVIIGGEKAGAGSADAWRRACEGNIPVFNTYGPTETAIVATAAPLVIPEDGSDPPIGRPLPGLKVRITDAAGRTAPPDRPGELWLGGAGVGLGYLKRPEATAAVFVPGDRPGIPEWYRTGDVASMDDDGVLHFLGRVDDQVKIRGKRIEPDEIRARLETVEGVRQAHVGAPMIDGRRRLVAWVVASATQEEIQVSLRRELPAWMVPAAFVFLENLPLNARGKVDRRALPVPQMADDEEEETGGGDSLEMWMASLFAEVLGIDASAVRFSADFAEQGGDSLSAMVLATRLAKAGVDLQPGELAVDSSPRLLAERIRQGYGKSRDSWEPILQLRAGDPGRTPLILIHATPGDVLGYANLVTELPPSLPCLGLVSKGLHLPGQAHGSIEEMAAAYIEVLRPRLEGHPWILSGWCYGGIVAYEMARQLVAAGEPEPFVMMIEAWAQSPAEATSAFRLKLAKLNGLLGMPLAYKTAFLRKRLFGNGGAEPAATEQPADDGFSRSVIYQANLTAINRYRPGPYGGELHLLMSIELDEGEVPVRNGGWHVLGARCRTHGVTGGHDLALRPPHVTDLARKVAGLVEGHLAS